MRGPASPRRQAWGGDDDLETAGTLLRCWTLGKARPSDLGRKVSGAGVRVRPRRDARRTRARRGSWSWGTASGISWPLAGPGAWQWASCPAATASRSSSERAPTACTRTPRTCCDTWTRSGSGSPACRPAGTTARRDQRVASGGAPREGPTSPFDGWTAPPCQVSFDSSFEWEEPMRARLSLSFLLVMSVLLAGAPARATRPALGGYIVVLKDSVSDPASVARQQAVAYGAELRFVYRFALKGYSAAVPTDRLAQLERDPRVAFVSRDRAVHAVGQSLPTGVDRIQGDVSSSRSGDGTGSVNVAVAIIDTGSGPHSDLNVVGGKNCSTGRSYNDGNGHGTHVAGSVAARDNSDGVVGVAPGAPIYSVRVLNNAGSGSWSSVICGVDWVTQNAASKGIKVANMSLGGSGSDGACNSDALHQAICNSVGAGITYVVAAGNSGTDFKGFVPAAYDQVLTVTAVADFNGQSGGGAAATCRADVDDTAADFSNYATLASDQSHTIAAPGVCILSTWKGGGYNTISGTSMASPHVTGTAALCISTGACSGTPAQIMQKLRSDAAAQPSSYGFTGVSGRFYSGLVYAGGY